MDYPKLKNGKYHKKVVSLVMRRILAHLTPKAASVACRINQNAVENMRSGKIGCSSNDMHQFIKVLQEYEDPNWKELMLEPVKKEFIGGYRERYLYLLSIIPEIITSKIERNQTEEVASEAMTRLVKTLVS